MLLPSCGERGSGEVSSVPPEGGTIAPGNYLIDPMFDTDEFLPGYDRENHFIPRCPWVRVGDTIIHSLENGNTKFFYYYDCNSGENGILCGKPDCTHEGDDRKDCDGFVIKIIGPDLSCYNGKLYWVGSEPGALAYFYLMESDTTGANRRKVRRISREMMLGTVNPSFVVHRGYVYYTGIKYRTEGTKDIASFVFSFSPISSKNDEDFEVVLDIDNDIYAMDYSLCYVGNCVYIGVSLSDRFELYRFNSKTRELETLIDPIPDFGAKIWVSSKHEVYLWQGTKGEQKLFHLDDGKLVTKMDFSHGERRTYSALINGIVILSRKVEDNRRYYEIYTVDGKQIYSGLLVPEEYKGLSGDKLKGISGPVYGCDENNLYVGYSDDRDQSAPKFLFLRFKFKDGNIEESVVYKGNQYYTGTAWW